MFVTLPLAWSRLPRLLQPLAHLPCRAGHDRRRLESNDDCDSNDEAEIQMSGVRTMIIS